MSESGIFSSYFEERFFAAIDALEEIAQATQRIADRLDSIGSGQDVINIESGLEKGEPLPVQIMKGAPIA